jgi:uroporphyrinogen-III decarboxylase
MHIYNEMDIDCWGYLTPPPYGDVVLEDALRIIRPDMVLRGNIDQVEFLVRASPAEIKAHVGRVLSTVKPRGNWILSTTDFFFDGCPQDNIMAFAEAGRQYGAYG